MILFEHLTTSNQIRKELFGNKKKIRGRRREKEKRPKKKEKEKGRDMRNNRFAI